MVPLRGIHFRTIQTRAAILAKNSGQVVLVAALAAFQDFHLSLEGLEGFGDSDFVSDLAESFLAACL